LPAETGVVARTAPERSEEASRGWTDATGK